jgi:hypothetical protein
MEQTDAPSAAPVTRTRRRLLRRRRHAFTQVPDWLILCERINPTAFRLWCILRSMQFEGGPPGIPPLTLDQVCWLLPGVNEKPTSKSRAREALDALLAEGLLMDTSPAGTSRAGARSYLAVDAPQRAMGWTGARRKLSRYHRWWRKQ